LVLDNATSARQALRTLASPADSHYIPTHKGWRLILSIPQGGGNKFVLFESKLEEEAAKVAGAVIGRSATGVMDTVSDVFGGLIGDAVREWRTRNLIGRLARTAEILKAKGVTLDKAKALPMGEAYAMFEEASKQDDPTVSEMWAALLANAMDPKLNVSVNPTIVSALRSINGRDAKVLIYVDAFFKTVGHLQEKHKDRMPLEITPLINFETKKLKEGMLSDFSEEEVSESVANLIRQGFIFAPTPTYYKSELTVDSDENTLDPKRIERALNELSGAIDTHNGNSDVRFPFERNHGYPFLLNYYLTEFGERFLTACSASTHPTKPNE
jgi:hypothetical protein